MEYTPDPFKNFQPRQNPKKAVKEEKTVKSPQNPLTEHEMKNLADMSKEELITLISRVCVAAWGYGNLTGKDLITAALNSKEEAYEALKLRAFVLASNAAEWREFHALATFWAEREKGKPKQSIDTTVTVGIIEIVEEIAKRRQVIDVTPDK